MRGMSDEAAFDYAKRALPMMAQHGVKPTPNNYAVWYVYVAGSNPELAHEIETIIKESMVFSHDINEYLYTKYIAESDSQIVQETTADMRRLTAELLSAITHFSGETKDYQSGLSEQMEAIPGIEDNSGLQGLLHNVMSQLSGMMDSGDHLTDKLEHSRQEIDDLKEKLAKIQTESERDFLTGVYNRKALDKKLEEAIEDCTTENKPLCMLMIDVDHFKAFNDEHGHLIGDEVLKIVAKCLTDSVKGKDVVARFGGEEFTVLLPNTPIGGGMIVADAIRSMIATKKLKHRDSGQDYGQLTVSVGVASYATQSDTIPTFIKRADDALYRAKNSGRNCVAQEKLKAA